MRTVLLPLLAALLLAGAWFWWSFEPEPTAPTGRQPGGTATAATAADAAGMADRGSAAGSTPDSERTASTSLPAATSPIHGTVTTAAGVPCVGAQVTAERSGLDEYSFLDRSTLRAREVVATAATDSQGRYALVVEPGRHHLVRARAAGLAAAARGSCVAGARVDFVLQPAAVLAGVVTDELRRAVPGTRIVVQSGGSRGEAITGSDGAYRIADLTPGEANVDVQPERLAAPRDADVTLLAGGVTVHDVVLLEGTTIVGRVLDATTRQGIAGAEVGEGLRGRVVHTDGEGAFVLPGFAPRHNLSVRVAADGYAPTDVLLRRRGESVEQTVVRVEALLVRGYAVRGRVVDAHGAPMATVYVAAAAADHDGVDGWFRSDWRSQRTGADGRFHHSQLVPGMRHEVVLVRRGLGTAVFAVPAPAAGKDEVDLGDLRLGPAGEIAGIVTDELGAPLVGHEIDLHGHNTDRWRFAAKPADEYRAVDGYVAARHARTDGEGRFRFVDLAPGAYVVRCQRLSSHDQETAAVEVAAERTADVRMTLFRGLELGGRVVLRDGSAVPKCYCSIDPEDGQTTAADVEVKGDGTFVAAGLQRGNYKVTVYPYASDSDAAAGRVFRSAEFAQVAAGTRALVCDLPVFGLVRGSVRTQNLAPALGWFVVLHDGEREVESSAIGPNGQFVLTAMRDARPLRLHVVPLRADGTGPAALTEAVLTVDAAVGQPPHELVLPR